MTRLRNACIAVSMCLAMLFGNRCMAAEISVIAAPTGTPDGFAKISFPPDTHWSEFKLLVAKSYEGTFRDGLAEGEGLLEFEGPEPIHYLNEVYSPPGAGNRYQGSFKQGRPVGPGKFEETDGNFRGSIEDLYTGHEVVFSVEQQPAVVITRLEGTNKVLVRAMQYRGLGFVQPSRMFFGEVAAGGKISGEWVDVPWFADNGDVSMAGYGRYLEMTGKDGGTVSCELDARPADEADLLPRLMHQVSGNPLAAQLGAVLDKQYLNQTKAHCWETNPNGWRFETLADFTRFPTAVKYVSCRTPDDKRGDVNQNGYCKEHQGHKQDVFTNIGREFKRFVDRRVIGSINRAGGAAERALCRATGTEPGKNCNVNIEVGASWPIGEGPAPGLSQEEQAARNAYIAANRKAKTISQDLGTPALGGVAAMDADLNAVCSTLCSTGAQRRYSANLLSELEAVAQAPVTEDSYIRVRSVNRETAQVLSGGIRLIVIAGPVVSIAVPFYRFVQSAIHDSRIDNAIDLVKQHNGPSNFDYLSRRNRALTSLYQLRNANLVSMSTQGGRLMTAYIQGSLRMLKNFPPEKVSMFSAAIAMGRTEEQVRDFVRKYGDIKTEKELYDALIKEAVGPLGIAWPPAT